MVKGSEYMELWDYAKQLLTDLQAAELDRTEGTSSEKGVRDKFTMQDRKLRDMRARHMRHKA